ncbi:LuxR family transcriptional regulator [Alishewanella sp. WH16-1]|uniref:response regulator n=1 Tax=Alishewanella sp. WH16-1 TaxID=1651088 RepID=UPI00070E2936|nr:response regulator transcription factor [Alishewanella sp. WH16-1]KRS21653.1 LuxR family transcriptional regulator [Alishewanella sp. WH16-1]
MITVVVADDHDIVRQGLVSIIEQAEDCEVIGQASDGVEALALLEKLSPRVLVVDISMPRLNGLEVVRQASQRFKSSQILVLTMHEEEEYVVHMVRAGANGYLVKSTASQHLLSAIRNLAAGKTYYGQFASQVLAEQYRRPNESLDDPYKNLTDREREVFHLVIAGASTKDIARTLDISVKTAENHRGKVLEKLNMHNSVELVRYAAKKGLLD